MRCRASLLAGLTLMACDANVPYTAPWFSAARAVDITGDGEPDTLVLRALGPVADSLAVELIAVIDGGSVGIDRWASSYELIDPPDSVMASESARAAYLRSSFTATLARARVESFSDSTLERDWIPRSDGYDCMDDPHECLRRDLRRALRDSTWMGDSAAAPFDTVRARTIIAELRSSQRAALRYSYGYESTVIKIWSPLTRRFHVLHSCC
jgi:hypothetical protein